MLGNNDVQKAILSWMKANGTILALLTDTNEIREENWQGEKFSYPNIRIMAEVTPSPECGPDTAFIRITSFSEQKSSRESGNMAGTIAQQIHNKTFTSESVRFCSLVVLRVPRSEQEDGIWAAEVHIEALVSPE